MGKDNTGRSKELSSTEAAAYCGYTINYFYSIASKIRHRKERGRNHFPVDALDEFLASQSTEHLPTEVL